MDRKCANGRLELPQGEIDERATLSRMPDRSNKRRLPCQTSRLLHWISTGFSSTRVHHSGGRRMSSANHVVIGAGVGPQPEQGAIH